MRRWVLSNVNDDYETLHRSDAATNRATAKPHRFAFGMKVFDCWQNNVLADWTKKMCFDYVTAHGETFNPLYLMGFDRIGCWPCIMWGKEQILNWVTRFPDATGANPALREEFKPHILRADGTRSNN